MDEERICRSTQYSLLFKVAALIYETLNYFLLKFRIAIQYYYYADKQVLNLINKLRFRRGLLLTIPESLQLYEAAKAAAKINGDFAEVGVYRGGSAKVIAKVKGKKKLHLFDTFEGLPTGGVKDRYFTEGEYAGSLDYVKNTLRGESNLFYYRGIFPKSGKHLEKSKFAFVHLDVDLYQSTKDCLEYFYPRMTKGGIIICHDYPSSTGVKKAVDEFIDDKPEAILKLSGNQGLIIKL